MEISKGPDAHEVQEGSNGLALPGVVAPRPFLNNAPLKAAPGEKSLHVSGDDIFFGKWQVTLKHIGYDVSHI